MFVLVVIPVVIYVLCLPPLPLTEMDIMFETDGDSNTFTTEKTSTNGTQETEHEDSDKQTSDDPCTGRRRSWIWSHFESFDGSARCRICSERLQACKGGSTGNMHRHMSAKHPEVLKTPISYSARKRSSSGNDVYASACLKWVHQEAGDSCSMKSSPSYAHAVLVGLGYRCVVLMSDKC